MFESVLVSVIICVFNTKKEFLIGCVSSILHQTHQRFEIIIVDDCSDIYLFDDPIFRDKRIKIFRNDANRGPAYSRNIGLKMSKGKYVAIMDSDDISLPKRLEEQIIFLENNYNAVACGTWFKFIGGKDHEVKRTINDRDYYKSCLLFGNVPTILNSSVMIRKSTLDSHSILYNENLRYSEDYDLWTELIKYGEIVNLEQILVHYRVHDEQMTSNNKDGRKTAPYSAIVKRKLLKEMGCVLTKEEESVFCDLILLDKKAKARKYKHILLKIYKTNLKTRYYDDDALIKRMNEQWSAKIYSINNPFSIICSSFFINNRLIPSALMIKFKQIKMKLLSNRNKGSFYG